MTPAGVPPLEVRSTKQEARMGASICLMRRLKPYLKMYMRECRSSAITFRELRVRRPAMQQGEEPDRPQNQPSQYQQKPRLHRQPNPYRQLSLHRQPSQRRRKQRLSSLSSLLYQSRHFRREQEAEGQESCLRVRMVMARPFRNGRNYLAIDLPDCYRRTGSVF